MGEGINSSVAVTEDFNGWRNFHVSGKVEASTEPQDMRLQRLLGHLTALMDENSPKSALVVGFGAGVTAGAIGVHPTVERIVVCELEPLIPNVVSTYFSDVNYDIAANPKVEIVYDDARHYVLTTRDKFDVITSDPIHPWVKGAATLYTKEYFEHVKARLNPGGVVTQWVPRYESTEEAVRSEVATFFEVFPNGTVWRNDDVNGRGYDVVLVGRAEETPIDVDAWQAKIDSPGYEAVKTSLAEVGYFTVLDLLKDVLWTRAGSRTVGRRRPGQHRPEPPPPVPRRGRIQQQPRHGDSQLDAPLPPVPGGPVHGTGREHRFAPHSDDGWVLGVAC